MDTSIRRELDVLRLRARERKLRMVMEILGGREAEYRRAQQPTPPGLRQSIADFGHQLSDVRRRRADLDRKQQPQAPRPSRSHGRLPPRRQREGAPDRA